MEREELLRRIEKKNKDIEKIEKRIAKWGKGLRPEDIAICEPFGKCVFGTAPRGTRWNEYHGTNDYQVAVRNYRAYVDREGNNIPSSDDWNKGPNISELRNAYVDLGEARNTLANYQVQLEKVDNFAKEEKVPAIWDFLCDWENKAYNWYLENAKKYFELTRDYDASKQAFEKDYLENHTEPSKDDTRAYREWSNTKRYYIRAWEDNYYQPINELTKNITNCIGHYEDDRCRNYVYYDYSVNTNELAKYLKAEKDRKYQDVVKRITSITGNIVDASGLYIGNKNGEINGIVVGEKAKAKVETISAGGWNIMCFHYRILVHEIK